MCVYVFLGPTLSPEDAGAILEATYLPPVSQGDVYRVARHRPHAIGIIDGYFHRVPAVWHKEILWAISQRIAVFGSSSMGALRAAELAPFGMKGIGRIFEAYLSGQLEDDDEVALLHADAPVGGTYPSFSVPMVNIRATLRRAAAQSVIAENSRVRIETIAKNLYYGDRDYERVLCLALKDGIPPRELERLRSWLPENKVDQKRIDAIRMLEAMRDWLSENRRAAAADFVFEPTELWRQLCVRTRLREADVAAVAGVSEAEDLGRDAVSAETRQKAHLRWLLLELARRDAVEVDAAALQNTILEFRTEHGLYEVEELERWLADNDLTLPEFVRLMEDEAKVRRMERWLELESMAALLDVIKLTGQYQRSPGEERNAEKPAT